MLEPAIAVNGKSPEAFRTISEVSADLDVPQHVLRFWESRFSQIRPVKRGGGRRYYRPEDVDLLRGIRSLLYADGFTIKGVQKVLREHGVRYVAEVGRGEACIGPAEIAPAMPGVVDGPAQFDIEDAISRAAPAINGNGHALSEERREKLEILLAELVRMKVRLRAARAGQKA